MQLSNQQALSKEKSESFEQYYTPRARDLMTSEPVSLSEDNTISELVDLMKWKCIRHVPVTDCDQRVIGLITQRDFLTIAISKLAHVPKSELDSLYSQLSVGEVMGKKVTTTSPNTLLTEAAEIMFRNKFGCLPVTEDGKLVGILTEADFVKSFMEWNVRFR
jgi:CBS domain-containing membrane protein